MPESKVVAQTILVIDHNESSPAAFAASLLNEKGIIHLHEAATLKTV